MVKFKHKGGRAKSRKQLTKDPREKGMPNISKILKEFDKGDKVHIEPDPSITSGLPHRKFFGKTGEVKGKQGKCYIVEVKDMESTKKTIVHPVHLKKQENAS